MFSRTKPDEMAVPVPKLPASSSAWPSAVGAARRAAPAALNLADQPPVRTPPFALLSPVRTQNLPPQPPDSPALSSPLYFSDEGDLLVASVAVNPTPPAPPAEPTRYARLPQPGQHRYNTSIHSVPGARRGGSLDQHRERPMAVFEVALAYLLQNEGNTFVNDPLDHGGPTRYGVTMAVLSNYLGRQASISDVQNIEPQTVSAIYRMNYWTPIRGDKIQPQNVATALLDMAALTGCAQAVRMMQAAVGTTPDGIMGPVTLSAINLAQPQAVLVSFSHKACSYFAAIALRDATQAKFLSGWQLRAHRMLAVPNAI